MNRAGSLIVFLVISFGLPSCSFVRVVSGKKNKEKLTITDTTRQMVIAPVPLPPGDAANRSADSIERVRQLVDELLPVWKKRLVYNTFSGKAKVHFDGPDGKQDFTAHIRMKKDSVIWITITAAMGGISVARLLITPDSLFVVNYLQKDVTMLPLTQAAKVLPAKLDFSSLQNLVLGEPLREGIITNATNLPATWSLQVEDHSYLQRIAYSKADSTMLTGNMQTRDLNGPQAMQEYEGYAVIDHRKISTVRVVHIQNGAKAYYMDLNFSRIEFDQPLDFPFSIPGNYEIKQ
jgi:hypothetical protein